MFYVLALVAALSGELADVTTRPTVVARDGWTSVTAQVPRDQWPTRTDWYECRTGFYVTLSGSPVVVALANEGPSMSCSEE